MSFILLDDIFLCVVAGLPEKASSQAWLTSRETIHKKKKKKQLRGKKNEDRNSREDRANFTPDAAIKKELPKEELPK